MPGQNIGLCPRGPMHTVKLGTMTKNDPPKKVFSGHFGNFSVVFPCFGGAATEGNFVIFPIFSGIPFWPLVM